MKSYLIVLFAILTTTAQGDADLADELLSKANISGGLVVQLGCENGELTTSLGAKENLLVRGLDRNPADISKIRQLIHERNLAQSTSVQELKGNHLPFSDNLVNLLVIEEASGIPPAEIKRVLSPYGVVLTKSAGQWHSSRKPFPKEMGDWTHYLQDANGNAVAKDQLVGAPRHIQWRALPNWTRSHHKLSSFSAMVSTRGRVFYIVDQGPVSSIESPAKWSLIARNAFSGVILWKKPISRWADHKRHFRSGPVQLPRTLVAKGDKLYVTLKINDPVSILDASNGDLIATCQGTENAEEIIADEKTVFVVTGSPVSEQAMVQPSPALTGELKFSKSIVAADANSGEQFWEWKSSPDRLPLPATLAVDSGRVFFVTRHHLICLDKDSGRKLWESVTRKKGAPYYYGLKKLEDPFVDGYNRPAGWSTATLVVKDGVVLVANKRNLRAYSVQDGSKLWESKSQAGFKSAPSLFVIDGIVWTGKTFDKGRDLHTGEIKLRNSVMSELRTAGHHHRCVREKATSNYILGAYRGIEMMDLNDNQHSRNNWIRGQCQYGLMPCNGLIYTPPHSCGCYMEALLTGFWATAHKRDYKTEDLEPRSRLEKGPAYKRRAGIAARETDWPMQRKDGQRSSATSSMLPTQATQKWHRKIGANLTPPTIANGKVFLASSEEHFVSALDEETGQPLWQFNLDARVDSAPTYYKGLLLFGCTDGWVYALNALNGELAWRFLAAPIEMNTVAMNQIESVWPIHGSILIQNGIAYFSAGRSSYLDGGIRMCALEPRSGKMLKSRVLQSVSPGLSTNKTNRKTIKIKQNKLDYKTHTDPDRSDSFSMKGGTTTDLLTGDGSNIYMRAFCYNTNFIKQPESRPHLFSTSSLLDGAENHRSHWVYGTGDFSHLPVAYSWVINRGAGKYGGWSLWMPHGLMLAFDKEKVWGIRRSGKQGYKLFRTRLPRLKSGEEHKRDFRYSKKHTPKYDWENGGLSVRPRAIVRTKAGLAVAGIPRNAPGKYSIYCDKSRGKIEFLDPDGGDTRTNLELPSAPIWDGLSAANNKLFVSLEDGSLVCIGSKK